MAPHLEISFYNPVSLSYQGGGEYWIIEVAKRLSARGHHVNVLTTLWSPSEQYKDVKNTFLLEDINLIKTRYFRFFRGFAVPSALDLSLVIKTFNGSDVVYFYVYPPNELIVWALRQKIRSAIIGGFHAFLAPERFFLHHIYMPFFKKALRAFDGLHVLNRFTDNLMKEWGYPDTYLIPNGVDTKIFKLRETTTDVFNVLYTGRLTEDKGADVLVEIIRYINEKSGIRDIKFTICGFGPLADLVVKLSQNHGNVKYLGFVSREELLNIYRNADLFLIPSRTEGMPLRLLEAQSCGLPAIGSNIPGISDIIVNGKTGQLADAGNIKAFVEIIKKYYLLWRSSPEQYYEMSRTIREHVVNNYDWTMIIEKIEKIFKECIQKHRHKNT